MNIETLHQRRDRYRTSPQGGSPVWFSGIVDEWIRSVCALQATDIQILVLALGGYGRGELFPFSDIDLLLLLPQETVPEAENLANALFVPLWDNGFEVGHGVRTFQDTLDLASRDYEVLCSLLDARLLCGSADVFAAVERQRDQWLKLRVAELVHWLVARHEKRRERFGETAHLLAPNLKEGRGGQRDLQAILWLEKMFPADQTGHVLLSASEHVALSQSAAFLAQVRVGLHRLSARKNDVVHLEMQPELAQSLGYGPAKERGAVERFLSDLHKAMTEIHLLCRLSLNKAQAALRHEGVTAGSDDGLDFSVLVAEPANILELFRHSAQRGVPIGWHTRRIIQERLARLGDSVPWRRTLALKFQDILCSPVAGQALEQMLEVGFLGCFLPEFVVIEHLVQFDAYHKLPVGPHLVETVRQMASFTQEHEFLGPFLAAHQSDPCLRWSALLHDIGKGGDEHSKRGALLGAIILARLGFDRDFCQRCSFLIEHHLLLVHTATRQDLSEESVILTLAATIGSVDRLESLMLLTWADSMATGPKAWTPWIAGLLQEVFFKTRKVLETGLLSTDSSMQTLSARREALRGLRPAHVDAAAFEHFLAVMPARYLMQTPATRIVQHMDMVRDFGARPAGTPFALSWEHQAERRSLCLTLVSTDQPGLFARVCAALVRHDLCVLGAELCVWDDKTVVDVFWITEPVDPLYADEILAAFEGTLGRLFTDESELEELPVQVAPRIRKVFAVEPELVQVHLDNSVSDFHTVLSIQAPDVPGLLAVISQSLYNLGIDLVFAKIATQKDKAMDILHIRENGEKIAQGELAGLERSLRLLICSLYA